jgi:hypothetical protein
MFPTPAPRPILCDSCGKPASPDHIRERMARLELATRFRPVHISLLLVCSAPPALPGDDLYAWDQQAAGEDASRYLRSLFQVVGAGATKDPAAQLAEIQRRGIYLARLVECPLEKDASLNALGMQYGPVLVKRIAYSYKPRQIALLAPVAPNLIDLLRAAGLDDRLVSGGQGIRLPAPEDEDAIARVRASLGGVPGVTDLA